MLAYQIKQTIGSSEECCDDFASIYYMCNMSMKESRLPYQYTNSKHSQLIVETISENRIIIHLVLWTRQAIEFDSIKSCRIWKKIASNAANHLISTTYALQYNCGKFNLEYVSNSIAFKFQEVGWFSEYCRA